MVPLSIRMHKLESRETSNRKYLSKTILACRERQAKKENSHEAKPAWENSSLGFIEVVHRK